MATYIYASSQGQRTHSAQTKSENFLNKSIVANVFSLFFLSLFLLQYLFSQKGLS